MVNTRLVRFLATKRCRLWPTGSTNTSSYCNDVMWIAVIIISSMGRKKEKELREMTDHSSLLFISESLVANSHQYRPSSSLFLKEKEKKKSGRPIWSSDMASRIGFEGFYFLSFFLARICFLWYFFSIDKRSALLVSLTRSLWSRSAYLWRLVNTSRELDQDRLQGSYGELLTVLQIYHPKKRRRPREDCRIKRERNQLDRNRPANSSTSTS